MPYPAIFINASLPATGYTIDRSKLIPAAGIYESLADAHWIPGATGNLKDLISQRPLCRQMVATVTNGGSGYTTAPTVTASDGSLWVAKISGGAVNSVICTRHTNALTAPTLSFSGGGGTGAAASVARGPAPTIGASSLTIPTGVGVGRALIAQGISDSANETICVVTKRPADASAAQVVFGTTDGSTPTMGSIFWHSGSADYYNIAHAIDASPVPFTSPGAIGDWLFFAVSYKSTVGRKIRSSGNQTGNRAGTKNPANSEIGIGNTRNPTFTDQVPLEVAEFIHFPEGLTDAEMLAVYNRSKARLAALPTPIMVA